MSGECVYTGNMVLYGTIWHYTDYIVRHGTTIFFRIHCSSWNDNMFFRIHWSSSNDNRSCSWNLFVLEPKGKFIPSYEQTFMVTQYIFLFGRNDNVPTANIVRAWNENISVFGERFLPHEFLSIPNKYNVYIFQVYLERQRTSYRTHCSCVAREHFLFFWTSTKIFFIGLSTTYNHMKFPLQNMTINCTFVWPERQRTYTKHCSWVEREHSCFNTFNSGEAFYHGILFI